MPDPDIDADFPGLIGMPYELASPATMQYNCIAFAFGDEENVWDTPERCGFYWPPGFQRDPTIEVITSIVQLHGFRISHEAISENPETDALAIYAKAGLVNHLAKWQDPGIWKSKLGDGRDINHLSLFWLEGELYGRVVSVWKRTRPI
jgi:hypothetical protein